MLRTMSRIKRVCAMILVPRLFRSAGSTPGKFYRLKFDAIRKAKKSTSSDHTDHNKRKEHECKKCKKIIEYAFGPAEPYRYSGDANKDVQKNLAHAAMYAKTRGPDEERLAREKDEKIIAEWLKLNVPPPKGNNATLLEDLKSKSLSDARANVLLRVRNLDTILAAVEKKEKEIDSKTAEDGAVLLAEESKEEVKSRDTATETKEHLVGSASVKEEKALKLQATSAGRKDEEEIKLAPKMETINEVPLVEAAPRTVILYPPKDYILNATRFERRTCEDNQSQIYDEVAQRYIQSPTREIDNHLVRDFGRFDFQADGEKLNMRVQEEIKINPEEIKNEYLDDKLKTVNTPEFSTESVSNSQQISAEPIKPAEPEKTIDSTPDAQKLVAQVNITADDVTAPDNLYCEFIGPAYDGRVALRDLSEKPVVGYNVDDLETEHSEYEHKQPCHLFRKTLVDVIHTTEPKDGLIVREYPIPAKGYFEEPRNMTDPVDKRTFDSEDTEIKDAPATLQCTKYSTVERVDDHVQPTTSLPKHHEDTMTSEALFRETSAPGVYPNRQNMDISNEITKKDEREPTRAAVEMAHSFIQAQPCAEPIQKQEHERKERQNPFTVDESLPDISLNDPSVSLTELLRRVRERNRILYCREVGLQKAKNKAALDPKGKCGDKKPKCPPPQRKCPPPPPPCPPPPPPCPKPCPPPPKCPQRGAKCPPPKNPCGKKDPCAKFKAQETITLVLHLGPLVNPGRKVLLPVIATNSIPATSSSEERPNKRFLPKWIKLNLSLLREVISCILDGRPSRFTDDVALLRLNRTRDYTPWSPIPSWPYPVIQRKRPLQCPKEGCPVDPPVNPAPRFQRPCPDRPCYNFPKRPN